MAKALKIMIIEDDLVVAADLQENLEEVGYQVTGVAQSDTSSRILFEANPPDLIIADINLGETSLTGIEIVKELTGLRHIPVIYLTAFSDSENVESAKSTRPAAYLVKPATKSQVQVSIDLALNNFYYDHAKPESNQHAQVCPLIKTPDAYFIKHGEKYVKIWVKDMCALESEDSCTRIYTPYKKYLTSGYLGRTLAQISHDHIIRCHRSWAINTDCIFAFNEYELTVAIGKELMDIPLGDTYKQEVFNNLVKLKSE